MPALRLLLSVGVLLVVLLPLPLALEDVRLVLHDGLSLRLIFRCLSIFRFLRGVLLDLRGVGLLLLLGVLLGRVLVDGD